jgi:NADPH2:quinone reductase
VRAIQVTRFGGPDVLDVVDLPEPEAGPGEVLVDVTGVGVNFADTHQTENTYLARQELPFVPGSEVVGTVIAGPRAGQRVCGFVARGGGYAERAVLSDAAAVPVPDAVSDSAALALLVQGTTAWNLLRSSARMAAGESVVVHAAAGGVGSLAVQLARAFGAGRVIATASTEEKVALARSLGADAGVVLTGSEPFGAVAAALRSANDGARVDVVLEMTGGSVFDGSLAALARFGRLVTYGLASQVEPSGLSPTRLMVGSKSVIGFWLLDCLTPDRIGPMFAEPLRELTGMVVDGRLRPQAEPAYALEDARRAHEDIRARRTTGKVVLDPRLPSGRRGPR